jgi:hypothetical protein
MSASAQAPRAADDLVSFPGTRAKVVAQPAEVARLLQQAHVAGRFAGMSAPRPASGGRVVVHVRLHPLRVSRRWPRRSVTTIVVIALIGALLGLIVQWLVSHLAVVVVLAALLFGVVAAVRTSTR